MDNTRYNIMSYHGDRSVFTTLQMDAMCDTSNVERDNVSHNDFLFADPSATGIAPNGSSEIVAIGGPYRLLVDAINAANGGDVILMRPGSYTEARVLRSPMTLRAVRRDVLTAGSATIRAQ